MRRMGAMIAIGSARNERGQDLTEYAMLIGFVALVVVGVVMLLGDKFGLLLGDIASEVGP